MRREPKLLLFDLGGVLVKRRDLCDLFDIPKRDRSSFKANYNTSPAVYNLECGLISPEIFASEFNVNMKLHTSRADILNRYYRWIDRKYKGVDRLLYNLRDNHEVACLSNTSVLHEYKLLYEFGFALSLDRQFLSHKLGFRKPSDSPFRHVAYVTGFEPHNIIYFDDELVHVATAKKLGIEAYHVIGFRELKKKLWEVL